MSLSHIREAVTRLTRAALMERLPLVSLNRLSLLYTQSLSRSVAVAAGLSHPLLIYLLFSYQQKLLPGASDEEAVTGTGGVAVC